MVYKEKQNTCAKLKRQDESAKGNVVDCTAQCMQLVVRPAGPTGPQT